MEIEIVDQICCQCGKTMKTSTYDINQGQANYLLPNRVHVSMCNKCRKIKEKSLKIKHKEEKEDLKTISCDKGACYFWKPGYRCTAERPEFKGTGNESEGSMYCMTFTDKWDK